MKNLFHDPAASAFREQLLAEHDRLVRETGFRVPAYVDRPANWGQPGSPAGDHSSLNKYALQPPLTDGPIEWITWRIPSGSGMDLLCFIHP